MDWHKLWLWDPIAPRPRRGGLPLHRGMLQRLLQWFFHPPDAAPPATLLIRLMAGGVFLWEGVMKFVFPTTLGVGRFLKLGIPVPEIMAPFVGVMEIVGGALFVLGLFTRLGAALALLLSLQLYIGLAYAPGEWYWTYGMLVLLGLTLAAIPAGRRLGVDQWLAPRLAQASERSRVARVVRWFV